MSRESVFRDFVPSNESFIAIRCSWNAITEPLLSNGRPLWLHYPGFQAVFAEALCSNGLFRHNIIMDVALPFGNRFLYA
jgi:hypothetical protein